MSYQPSTGHKMKFYRSTGTYATPVWVEISNIGDLSIPDLTRSMAELKRRGNNFTKNLPGLIQTIGIEFRLPFGLDAAGFLILRNAFFNGTSLDYAIMNDTITNSGSQGLRLTAYLQNFPWDQNLEDVSGQDIRLVTAYAVDANGTEIDPTWMLIP